MSSLRPTPHAHTAQVTPPAAYAAAALPRQSRTVVISRRPYHLRKTNRDATCAGRGTSLCSTWCSERLSGAARVPHPLITVRAMVVAAGCKCAGRVWTGRMLSHNPCRESGVRLGLNADMQCETLSQRLIPKGPESQHFIPRDSCHDHS